MEGSSDRDTILVVEDVEAIRRMVCGMLSQCGYRCLEAGDGAEALRVLSETCEVSLILTDMIMPVLDGPELARRVVRMRPEVRIIFMSGYMDDAMVRSIEQSPTMFLAKPFTATALMDKVRQSLARPWNGVPHLRPGSAL